jgi:hypothetical protein
MALDWNLCRRHTAGGIPYKLISGPDVEHSSDATSASETYLIRATDMAGFMNESIPPPFVMFPWVMWPNRRRMPGTTFFVTKNISAKAHTGSKPCDPFNADPTAVDGTYDNEMQIVISYEVNKESDKDRDEKNPESFLEHSVQVGGEFYELANSETPTKLRHDSLGFEPTVIPEPSGFPGTVANPAYVANKGLAISEKHMPTAKLTVATVHHNFKWPFVINPPWFRIFDMLGKLNATAQPLWNNAPAETILFEGVSGSQKYVWNGASAGVQPWSMDFKFSQRMAKDTRVWSKLSGGAWAAGYVTWNHAWLNSARGWIRPYWLPDESNPAVRKPLYDAADLYLLFQTM